MKERRIIILCCVVLFASCSSMTMKLSIPEVFKEQATMSHVKGARKNKMSFDQFSTSKIKRGMHITSPSYNPDFYLGNRLLNMVRMHKVVNEADEKAKFRFTVSDGNSRVEIFAKETEFTRNINYRVGNGNGILNSFERLESYEYIFSAALSNGGKKWELLLTNVYDRELEKDNSFIKIPDQNDNGLATNGQDTIFIKGLALKKTEMPSGKVGYFPIKMLSGYELSTPDGIIAIIDLIGKNVWFYNELDNQDRLIIAAIATAIFARRVKNAW